MKTPYTLLLSHPGINVVSAFFKAPPLAARVRAQLGFIDSHVAAYAPFRAKTFKKSVDTTDS